MDPITIKHLPDATKVIHSIIYTVTKEVDFSYAWKLVSQHFTNGSFQKQGIGFDQYYIPLAHADLLRINIAIADMNIITARILYVSNTLQNKNVPINEIFVSVHNPVFWTGLKSLTLMFLSIGMAVRFSPMYEYNSS